MTNEEKFIGRGLVFPIKLDNEGRPATATGFPLLESDLRILLSWPAFERYMLAEYGSRAFELLEQPNDAVTQQVMRRFTIDTITQWEKRVKLVTVTTLANDLGTLIAMGITYKIINTNLQNSFVFPFYEKIIY